MASPRAFEGNTATLRPATQAGKLSQVELNLWQDDALLRLIFSLLVFVRGLASLIRLEEDDLAKAFVGIDPRGQRGGIGNLEGDEALPLGLERCDVDDDAAARIGGLPEAYREHTARDLQPLDRARQGERVRGYDADRTTEFNEGLLIKVLGIDNGAVHVGKDLKLVGHSQIVAIG